MFETIHQASAYPEAARFGADPQLLQLAAFALGSADGAPSNLTCGISGKHAKLLHIVHLWLRVVVLVQSGTNCVQIFRFRRAAAFEIYDDAPISRHANPHGINQTKKMTYL